VVLRGTVVVRLGVVVLGTVVVCLGVVVLGTVVVCLGVVVLGTVVVRLGVVVLGTVVRLGVIACSAPVATVARPKEKIQVIASSDGVWNFCIKQTLGARVPDAKVSRAGASLGHGQ
jgi:hypothetical protein